jgi:hypothetical protein
MTEIKQPNSWRDQIKVHPAADLFPMMTPDELKVLGEDIKNNGIRIEVTFTKSGAGPSFLVDGRNRLDAAELVGLPVLLVQYSSWPENLFVTVGDNTRMAAFTDDPWGYVLSANVHRRHLTLEQKRDLITKVLMAQPEKSNRTIAKQTKTDHKTVGAVRERLEAGGEIPHHDVREDARGTEQPAHKPPTSKRRDAEAMSPVEHIMDLVRALTDEQRDELLTAILELEAPEDERIHHGGAG